jgi:hypothetical protein
LLAFEFFVATGQLRVEFTDLDFAFIDPRIALGDFSQRVSIVKPFEKNQLALLGRSQAESNASS